MNRKELEERLAKSAVKAEVINVDLPSGDSLTMRRLTTDEMIRAATAAGNDLDQDARFFTGALRFSVIDDEGQPLLHSFAEAAGFVNTLSPEDFKALGAAVQKVQPATGDQEVAEAGKAS